MIRLSAKELKEHLKADWIGFVFQSVLQVIINKFYMCEILKFYECENNGFSNTVVLRKI